MAQNITQIPAARVPLVDTNTGLVNRDWYRFLSNLYTLAGQGSNAITLDDMQVSPPYEYRDEDDWSIGASVVADLPSAATVGIGARSFVSDALGPVFGSAVVGGGAVSVPVYSDGANWKVG